MQKQIAKSLAVGALVAALGLVSFTGANAKSPKAKTKVAKTEIVKTVSTKTVSTKPTAAKTKVVKGHVRTLPGKVTGVSGTSITMKKGNQTYTIEASGITPVNRKGSAIAVGDIAVGHKISVRGLVTGTTVSQITKLRDVTLPVSTDSIND